MPHARQECGVSPIVGVILMVAVTVIVALLILAMFPFPRLCNPFPPTQIEVVMIHDYNEERTCINYDSRVLLRYIGAAPLQNRFLSARFYVDDVPIRSFITTFHGQDFIPTHHFGVERMGGLGCQGEKWEPGATVLVDFKDGTFKPGQVIRTVFLDSPTGCIISQDEYRAPGPVL